MRIFKILLCLFFLMGAFKNAFAQNQIDNKPLAEQAEELLKTSKKYTYTTNVNTVKLEVLLQSYSEALQAAQINLQNQNTTLENNAVEIQKLKKTNEFLQRKTTEKATAKRLTLFIFQIVSVFLFLLVLFLGFKIFNMRTVVREAVYKKNLLQEAYDSLQENSIKRQEELSRKLQDEILKNKAK